MESFKRWLHFCRENIVIFSYPSGFRCPIVHRSLTNSRLVFADCFVFVFSASLVRSLIAFEDFCAIAWNGFVNGNLITVLFKNHYLQQITNDYTNCYMLTQLIQYFNQQFESLRIIDPTMCDLCTLINSQLKMCLLHIPFRT